MSDKDFAAMTPPMYALSRIKESSLMKRFARPLSALLSLITVLLWGDKQRIIMPKEIGVSCRQGKPFTATARTTLTRVFSSGTRRSVTTEDRIARDGEGRVLSEQHLPWTEDPAHPIYYVNILDPKDMERMHIDPQEHVVSKRPIDKRYAWDYVPYDGTQYRLTTQPGVTVHTVLLGNRDINGLKCWGQRTTYLFQPSAFEGNQQPVTRTWEVWYSKDLGSDVRIEAHDPDPKAGDQQTDLINVNYGEPDPSTFVLPADYSVRAAH
jgi:hypothetical protein